MMTDKERLLDLLTEKLVRELTSQERADLDRLLTENPEWRLRDLDFAAAAIHLAFEPDVEPMPEELKARIIGSVIGEARAATSPLHQQQQQQRPPIIATGGSQGSGAEKSFINPIPITRAPAKPKRNFNARQLIPVTGWLAAAAAVIFAVVSLPQGDLDPIEGRAALLKEGGVVAVPWTATPDALGKNVTGDVVWNDATQTGYMRFAGLPANDAKILQYQLWIFDGERDERYPVDGGVFDINADTGEVIVPIRAKVQVGKAVMFAVTVEKPGGVVVSKRERIVALGKFG